MIDWFTVGAQIVNFLILVGLLKHFLYGPIVNAMDKREEKIRNRLQAAEEKRDQAENRVAEYERKRHELEEQEQDLLREAREKADGERKERMRKAREEIEALSREWRSSVERERDAFLDEARRTVGRQALTVARRALRELADADVERQMAHVFLERLRDMQNDERQVIADALKGGGHAMVVRTAYEPADEDRERIEDVVRQGFGKEVRLEFARSEELIAGIELVADGRKIGWTLSKFLDDTTEALDRLLQRPLDEAEGGQPAGRDEPEPPAREQEAAQPAEGEGPEQAAQDGGSNRNA